MTLDDGSARAPRRCRLLVLLAGCPSSQNPGSGDDHDGGATAATPAAARRARPVPTCSTTIEFHGTGDERVAARRLRRRRLDHRRRDDADRRRLHGHDPRERRAGHRLQVRRRRHLDRRPREPAQVARRLRRASTRSSRVDCDHCPARAADRLARRDHVLRDDRSLRRRRFDERHDRSPAPSTPASTRAATSSASRRRSTPATSPTSASTRSGSPRRSTTRTRATPAPTATSTPAITATGRRTRRSIDSHYGTEAELKTMVDHAHAHGIQVLARLRDEPRHDRQPDLPRSTPTGSGRTTTARAATACAARAARTFNTGVLVRHVPADVQHAERRRAQVVRRQRRDVGEAARHRRLPARRGQAGRDRVVHRPARALERRGRVGPAVLHGRRDVRRQPRSHQVVRQSDTMLDGQFDFPLRGQMLSTRAPPQRPDERPRRLPRLQRRLLRHRRGDVDVPRQPRRAARDRARARHAAVRPVGRRQGPTRGATSRCCRPRRARSSGSRSRTRCCSRCPGSR